MSRLGKRNENKALGQLAWMCQPNSRYEDDVDRPLTVELGAVHYFPDRVTDIPRPRRGLHWLIRWHVCDDSWGPFFRVIEVRVESQDTESKQVMGVYPRVYTNWGPTTKSLTDGIEATALWIKIGTLSLRQRQALEAIAAAEQVRYPGPNEMWNCQDWIKSILHKTVRARLLREDVVRDAIASLEVSSWFTVKCIGEDKHSHINSLGRWYFIRVD